MPVSGGVRKILERAYKPRTNNESRELRACPKLTRVVMKIMRFITNVPTLLSAIRCIAGRTSNGKISIRKRRVVVMVGDGAGVVGSVLERADRLRTHDER